MFAALLAGFAGIRTYLIGGVAIVVATLVGVLWLQLHSAQTKLDAAKINMERQAQAIIALELVAQARADAVEELERANKEAEARSAKLSAILEQIRRSPAKDNGKIAPVLQKTLKRLGK